jgi:hypothetical protein
MHVYLDESGDTGWTFAQPYRQGGSSRYLCLAFIFLPHGQRKAAKDIMSSLYRKYGWSVEKKASDAQDSQREEFADLVVAMLKLHPEIKIDCIVTKKENVQPHIRLDGNKIYNYMCRLVIPEYVKNETSFHFCPDKRSIKVESGHSLPHYLDMVLGFEYNSPVELKYCPLESTHNRSLQFVDWMANCVWRKFENGNSSAFDKMSAFIRVRKLYFVP